MPTFDQTKGDYARRWDSMSVNKDRATQIEKACSTILASKARYQAVERGTGVPWWFIGCLHYREASNSFAGVLHNGERIIGTGKKTSLVPKGRGPFSTWESAAIDALGYDGLTKVKDWTIERALYQAEAYNGWGYYNKKVPSAYVWSGTDVYKGGKYVADGVWSATAQDAQLGVAPIIKRLCELDSSIVLPRDGVPSQPAPKPVTVAVATAVVATAAAGASAATWWDQIRAFFHSILG